MIDWELLIASACVAIWFGCMCGSIVIGLWGGSKG